MPRHPHAVGVWAPGDRYHPTVELERSDVVVLRALRRGTADALVFPGAARSVARLVEQGLVRDDAVTPRLTDEGTELAAKLEREWPQ